MTYLEFKTQVKLRLDNMQAADPFEDYVGDWVNEATNGVILRTLSTGRKSLNLFIELRDKWLDTTVLDQDYISIPADVLILTHVYSFDKTAASANSDRRYPMVEINQQVFELLPKATTTTGYPRLWCRYGNRIQLHPIPRTGYQTDVFELAIARESEMTADGDTPVMSELWHGAVEDYAVYLGATKLGWSDVAGEALASCDRKITQTVDILGLERSTGSAYVTVKNDPTR